MANGRKLECYAKISLLYRNGSLVNILSKYGVNSFASKLGRFGGFYECGSEICVPHREGNLVSRFVH